MHAVVSGICPVVETPFLADGELDREGFARVVQHLLAAGTRSFMYPGFASEFLKLTDDERAEMVELLIETVRPCPDAVVVVSIPDHSAHIAVQRARAAVAAGAHAINVLPPHRLGPSATAVQEHILAIAAAVEPVPVVLQYAPAETGTALDAPTIAALARRAPNIVQVKVESTPPGRLIAALAAQAPSLTSVVGYGGLQLIDALRRGAVGAQPGCSFIEIYLKIWSLWHSGDEDTAVALHRRLLPYVSYWMQEVELILAAEKRISYRRGLIATDVCREPARMLDAEEKTMIERFLQEFDAELRSLDADG